MSADTIAAVLFVAVLIALGLLAISGLAVLVGRFIAGPQR